MKPTTRNFNTISPSAKSLLFMKGMTSIPYARQTAELLAFPKKYTLDRNNPDFMFWARTLHFEERYWSIDNLLSDLPVKNVLELSSGFSFRGLEASKKAGVYYIDTDLPSVIEEKKKMIPTLKTEQRQFPGTLELLPLNALDPSEFQEVINCFPPGEIIIVNEGLLMYLDTNEKEKLCGIIRQVLEERGGCWITADIYIRSKYEKADLKIDKNTSGFLEQHKTEENKFESIEKAEAFFRRLGFVIEKEGDVDPAKLSTLKYVFRGNPEENEEAYKIFPKMRKTWRLRID